LHHSHARLDYLLLVSNGVERDAREQMSPAT